LSKGEWLETIWRSMESNNTYEEKLKEIDDNESITHKWFIAFFLIIFLAILIAIFSVVTSDKIQEPALSRYCINYCIKDHLSVVKGDIEFNAILDHCKKFFENITCCQTGTVYGECNIKTLKNLQSK
jgi:nitrogen fixation/metabolism regulation signal transduction histidine kinase